MKSRQHLKLYKHMHELGVEHFYIELVEDCPCDRNEELVKKRRRTHKKYWNIE